MPVNFLLMMKVLPCSNHRHISKKVAHYFVGGQFFCDIKPLHTNYFTQKTDLLTLFAEPGIILLICPSTAILIGHYPPLQEGTIVSPTPGDPTCGLADRPPTAVGTPPINPSRYGQYPTRTSQAVFTIIR